MAEIHILNVGAGSCTLIKHTSGRWTMIDICGGNGVEEIKKEMVEEQYEGQTKSASKNSTLVTCCLKLLEVQTKSSRLSRFVSGSCI